MRKGLLGPVSNVSFIPEFRSATSATAASITGNGTVTSTQGLTGNSIIVSPGPWFIVGAFALTSSGGTAAYSDTTCFISDTLDGTAIGSTLQAGNVRNTMRFDSATWENLDLNVMVRVNPRVTTTYYGTPSLVATTHSRVRAIVRLYAERVR